MTIRDERKVPVACCPLCGGEELEALEKYQIVDKGLPYPWIVHGKFEVQCGECFVKQDIDFLDGAESEEEVKKKAEEAFKEFEDHWARKDYKETEVTYDQRRPEEETGR